MGAPERDTPYQLGLTLTSLASSSTLVAGRESDVIDLTAWRGCLVGGKFKVASSGVVAGVGELYAWGSYDDTPTPPDNITGADAALTLSSVYVKECALHLVAAVGIDTTVSQVYWFPVIDIVPLFGPVAPAACGLVFLHNSSAALSGTASDHKFWVTRTR